jgi:hypothetical protein
MATRKMGGVKAGHAKKRLEGAAAYSASYQVPDEKQCGG